MTLTELAYQIDFKLRRFARTEPAYAGCGAEITATEVLVKYSSCDEQHRLGPDEAMRYLRWLERGGVGTHWMAEEKRRA